MDEKEAILEMMKNLRERISNLEKMTSQTFHPNSEFKKLKPFIYLLKLSSPSLIIPENFMLTSIRRNYSANFDSISSANYAKSLLKINIGNYSLMNRLLDINVIPHKYNQDQYTSLENTFDFARPYPIEAGTKITIDGGSAGLSGLTFALHGYHIDKLPVVNELPYIVAIRIDDDEDRSIYVVPKDVDFYIVKIYNFYRLLDSGNLVYKDMTSVSDFAVANLFYRGYQNLVDEKTDPSIWSGTPDIPYILPSPIKCIAGTNIMIETTTATATRYRWFVLNGYKRLRR